MTLVGDRPVESRPAEGGRTAFFCRRSLFLSQSERRLVHDAVALHLSAVTERLASSLKGANLYVSGSLARGEPSIAWSNGVPRLVSDVDLVIVEPGPCRRVDALEPDLRQAFPDYVDTLYSLSAESVGSLVSASAWDLFQGMSRPLMASFNLATPALPRLRIPEMLEVFVYQLAGTVCADDRDSSITVGQTLFWHQDSQYQRLKAAVELLRSLSVFRGEEATFQSAYALRRDPLVAAVVGEHETVSLLRSRERWSVGPVPSISRIGGLVRRALTVLLERPGATDVELLTGLRSSLYHRDNVLNGFPLIVFAFMLSETAAGGRARILAWLRRLFLRIPETRSEEAPEDREALLRYINSLRQLYVSEMIIHKDRGGRIWPPWEPRRFACD